MMGELIPLFPRPEDTPEGRAHLIRRLADIDAQLEPLEREAEAIRRRLGLLGIEAGLEDNKEEL